jgi:hypothetical protein
MQSVFNRHENSKIVKWKKKFKVHQEYGTKPIYVGTKLFPRRLNVLSYKEMLLELRAILMLE